MHVFVAFLSALFPEARIPKSARLLRPVRGEGALYDLLRNRGGCGAREEDADMSGVPEVRGSVVGVAASAYSSSSGGGAGVAY